MLHHSQPLCSPTYMYGFNPYKHILGLHLSKLLSPLQSDTVCFLSFLLTTQHSSIFLLLFLELLLLFLDNVFLVLFMKVLCPHLLKERALTQATNPVPPWNMKLGGGVTKE